MAGHLSTILCRLMMHYENDWSLFSYSGFILLVYRVFTAL